MKKVFTLATSLTLLMVLTSCGTKTKVEECEVKEIIKEVPVEVIKEVEVERIKEVPADVLMYRKYKPGTYFRVSEENSEGVSTMAVVVIDKYGNISGVHFDNTSQTNQYKYDPETKKVYLYVEGIEDVLPSSYRLVNIKHLEDKPTIFKAMTNNDLIYGYPLYEEKIEKLVDLNLNETRQVADFLNPTLNSWSNQMDRLAEKIILDQTTYGINLYEAGGLTLTNSVENITYDVKQELALVQAILDNEAKLESMDDIMLETNNVTGLYRPNTASFTVSLPDLADGMNGIYYDLAYVVTDSDGEISGVFLDETTNFNGKSTTKWALGDDYNLKEISNLGIEWHDQVKNILDRVVVNQGINGLKYGEGKNKDFITNVSGVSIKGSNLIKPLKTLLTSKDLNPLTLVQGVYSNIDDKGNMVTIVIDKYGKISAVNFDSLITSPKNVVIDGKEYPLYSYEKGTIDLSLAETRVLTYVYLDNDKYYELNSPKKKEVKFDYSGYDEKATLKRVEAVETKKALGDTYVMDEGKLWLDQITKLEDYLVLNQYGSLNYLEDGKTDTITGVTIRVKDYLDLLNETLYIASSKDNLNKSILQTNFNDLGLDGYKLAKGNYTNTSDIPNKDGGTYLVNLIVLGDNEVYLSLDETVNLDGKLTTKNSLDNYLVKALDSNLVEDPKGEVYHKVLQDNLKQTKFNLSNALVNYDYELDTNLKYVEGTSILDNEVLLPFVNGLEKALLESLQRRVVEVQNNIVTKLSDEDYFDDNYLVASSDVTNKNNMYKVNLVPNDLVIAKDIKVKFRLNSEDKINDVEEIDNEYYLTSDARKLDKKKVSKFDYQISFDDYKTVDGILKVNTLTSRDFNKERLNTKVKISGHTTDVNKYLNRTSNKILDKSILDLRLQDQSLTSDRLGSATTKLYFTINEMNNLKVYLNELNFIQSGNETKVALDYNNSLENKELFSLDGSYDLMLGTTKLSLTTNGRLTFNANSDLLDKANWNLSKLVINEIEYKGDLGLKMVDLLSVKKQQVLNDLSQIIVIKEDKDAASKISLRAFFDDYLQDEEYLETYQKGEAYRDFKFEVLSVNEALKKVKEATGVDHILNEIMNDMTLELTSSEDLGIDGLKIRWFDSLSGKEILDNDGKFNFEVTTGMKRKDLTLTALYVFNDELASGDVKLKGLATPVNKDYIKQFRIIVEPTNPKVLDELVKQSIDKTFFKEYVDIKDVLEDELSFSDLELKPIKNHSDLLITNVIVKNSLDQRIESKEYLYDAIIKEVGNFKASGTKDAKFKVEVEYLYQDTIRKVSKDFVMHLYSNSANKELALMEQIAFDLGSSTEDSIKLVEDTLNNRKNKNKRYMISEFEGTSEVVLESESFEGEVIISGISDVTNLTINLPKAKLTLYGDYTNLDVNAKKLIIGKGSTIDNLTKNESEVVNKGTINNF